MQPGPTPTYFSIRSVSGNGGEGKCKEGKSSARVPLFTHAMESLGLLCVGVRVLAAATLPPRRGPTSTDVFSRARRGERAVEGIRGRLHEQRKGVFSVLYPREKVVPGVDGGCGITLAGSPCSLYDFQHKAVTTGHASVTPPPGDLVS